MRHSKLRSNGVLQKIWDSRKAYFLLIPIILCLVIFNYFPPLMGFYRSLFNWSPGTKASFAGLNNYSELFKDTVFFDSLLTLLKLTVPRLIISVTVPFLFAELIFAVKNQKLKYIYRVMLVLPLIAPGIVNTYIWKFFFDPINGLAVNLCRGLGIVAANQPINWLGDPSLVIPSIVFMGFPWIAGTGVLVYLSGLIDISQGVIESALLDGCGIVRRIVVIDLPLVMGQLKFFIITGLISLIQEYGTQLLLTKGGPGYSTYVPGWHLYLKAFTEGRMGYACAIGVIMFCLIMFLTILIRKVMKSEPV